MLPKKQGLNLEDGDVLVIAHKIVSKAEGRLVKLDEIRPSGFAKGISGLLGKSPEEVEAILQECKSIIRMRKGILICETKHGFICANAGVDRSNVQQGYMLYLPKNPDASAKRIRRKLENLTGKKLAVIISDTFGRPWREGQVDFAIGLSGIKCFRDYRGKLDSYGRKLKVTNIAHVDELAAAAELVMGKLRRVPVVIIRGYRYERGEERAKKLIRKVAKDLFR
jgi:coenzyme F420-0:L-glutamate ligase/coenzyme F420-1:gamma-L-glutamate ligase